MPPVVFVGSDVGTFNFTSRVTFDVPAAAKPGDHLIAVVATTRPPLGIDDAAWEELGTAATPGDITTAIVARRVLAETDGATVTLDVDDVAGYAPGVLLVYRGLVDDVAAAISFSQVSGSTNFVCPSRTLAGYADLYVGVVVVDDIVAVTPPAGATERIEQQGPGATIAVFDLLPEVAGATGTKTATTGAAESGVAGSIALVSLAAVFAKSISFAPAGAPGLPAAGI